MKKQTFKQFYLSEQKLRVVKLADENPNESDDIDSLPEDEEHLEKSHDKHKKHKKKHHDSDENHRGDKDEDEDDNRQGIIRTIKGAHLLYKRKDTDGTYTELWTYDIGKNLKDEYNIRAMILNGTDINHKTGASDDGNQFFELWTSGDRQFMEIKGLEN